MKKLIKTKFGDVNIVLRNEDKDVCLVFLHGWLMNLNTFDDLCEYFCNYTTLQIDFLGFGESSDPIFPMTIPDYAQMLDEVINQAVFGKKIVLIGHSFGGRVCIYYSYLYEVDAIFLINAKAFKNKTLKHKIKILIYKTKKLFFYFFSPKKLKLLKENSGSLDYKNVNTIMKNTMKLVVNFDLGKYLKKIKTKAFVLGSINDSVVDYKETLKIYKYLKNSKLYPFYSSNHFAYQTEMIKVVNIIKKEVPL